MALNKARSYIRSSNLDFFESVLKPKKFVDVVQNLTIYYEKKNENGELEKVVLSRSEEQHVFENPIQIFKRLFNTYKNAMVLTMWVLCCTGLSTLGDIF